MAKYPRTIAKRFNALPIMKIRTRLNRFVRRRRGNETHYGFLGVNGIYRPITADARPQTVFHLYQAINSRGPTPPAPPGAKKVTKVLKSSQKFSKRVIPSLAPPARAVL